MPLSPEVRRLQTKWDSGSGWPKRLDWVEIRGLRGWEQQRFELRFPIMAIVGENGVGKSTVLQCAASVYRSAHAGRKDRFASDFFPDTPWDEIKDVDIRYAVREAGALIASSIRKPGSRWRGNPQRRQRHVEYIDLSRIQPVPARVGYTRLANKNLLEVDATSFEKARLARFSGIMGRTYDLAKMALTSGDRNRAVPVIEKQGALYSGFHQGAGETTVAELLQADIPPYSLVLIDEVESSLHPRAQRRLIRDLAELCREHELQVILTTHSPYVLEELPLEARACILQTTQREIIYGVSPEFAMTKMDDVPHEECDLYVEDPRAAQMLTEILAAHEPSLVQRCRTIPYGAASVGHALGQMIDNDRFPTPSCVFLDGDQPASVGCLLLPGNDAPERVVFEALRNNQWSGMDVRTGRAFADVADACNRAMTLTNHHDWVRQAATQLTLAGDNLWQAMCAEWAISCLEADDALPITQAIGDTLSGIAQHAPVAATAAAVPVVEPSPSPAEAPASPSESATLFDR